MKTSAVLEKSRDLEAMGDSLLAVCRLRSIRSNRDLSVLILTVPTRSWPLTLTLTLTLRTHSDSLIANESEPPAALLDVEERILASKH